MPEPGASSEPASSKPDHCTCSSDALPWKPLPAASYGASVGRELVRSAQKVLAGDAAGAQTRARALEQIGGA